MATGTAVRGQPGLDSATARNGAGPQDAPEIVTFPDLVRAHRAWEVELYGCARDARAPNPTLEVCSRIADQPDRNFRLATPERFR